MPDNHSPSVRSYNMSSIHNKNTKLEELVRKFLFSCGLRYRVCDKRYPGKQDLVFPKYKTAVFVNGCFWHWHKGCLGFVMPKSRLVYWKLKLKENRKRDTLHVTELEENGWHVLTVWECLKQGCSPIVNTLRSNWDNHNTVCISIDGNYKGGFYDAQHTYT
jgi:DNA mismatch endonuclease (patch repair protein)